MTKIVRFAKQNSFLLTSGIFLKKRASLLITPNYFVAKLATLEVCKLKVTLFGETYSQKKFMGLRVYEHKNLSIP